ncbi:MAG: hypothetical protein IT384_17970 [Deltaproteobacteria bacterium]|nr:hypothetical protein [Deltaproteobacteria bacterium]
MMWVVAAVACGGAERLDLPLPEGVTASAVVVAAGERVVAGDLRGADPIHLVLASEAAVLELAVYTLELEELGLVSGALDGAPSCERRCGLLEPDSVWTRVVEPGAASPAWTRGATGLSDALRARLMPEAELRCGCGEIDLEEIDLETSVRVAFLAGRDDDTAWIGLEDGRLLQLSLPGTVEERCRVEAFSLSSGAVDASGALWLSGDLGELARVAPATFEDPICGFDLETRAPVAEVIHRLSVPTSAEDPLAVYALTSSGAFARFDGQSWTLPERLDVSTVPVYSRRDTGEIIRLGPSDAVAFAGSAEVIRLAGTVPTRSSIVISGINPRLQTGLYDTELGFVVSSAGSGVYMAPSLAAPFTPLTGTFHTALHVGAIRPLGARLLMTPQGRIEQFRRRQRTLCSWLGVGPDPIHEIAILRDGVVVLGAIEGYGTSEEIPTRIVLVRRRASSCGVPLPDD